MLVTNIYNQDNSKIFNIKRTQNSSPLDNAQVKKFSADSFESSLPVKNQVSFCGFFDFLKLKKNVANSEMPELTPPKKHIDVEQLKNDAISSLLKDSEIFDLETFKEYFNKIQQIERRFEAKNNDSSIRFVLNNLPDIFLTVENDKEYKNFVDSLTQLKGNWNMQDEYGNTLLHRAVIAENPYLTGFALSKNVDMSIQNKAGKTVEHILKDLLDIHPYEELDFIFRQFKFQKAELVDYAREDIASAVKMFLEDKTVDVNSREFISGDTALIAAAKNNSIEVLNVLKTHPELDVNAVNNAGDNAGIEAAKKGNIEVLKVLNSFDDFDINYINPNTMDSVYTTFRNQKTLDTIMENKKANPNLGKQPAIFRILDRTCDMKINDGTPYPDICKFELLCKHPEVNLGLTYKDVDIIKYAENTVEYLRFVGPYDNIYYERVVLPLLTTMKNRYIDSVKTRVELDGVLTLDKIQEFLTYPNLTMNNVNTPLNDMNEPIGFFLADIEVNRENLSQFIETFKSLTSKGYNFNCVNKAGQTLLDKAKDAQNDILVEYITKFLRREK